MLSPFFARLSRAWDPWSEFRRLQRDVGDLLERVSPFRTFEFPPVNVWVSENDIVVTAEIPGVQPDQLDISVVGNTLTLRGERKPEELADEEAYHRQERFCGRFVRTLQLPYDIDADKVAATCERGVLRVVLPRTEASKPRRIAVHHE